MIFLNQVKQNPKTKVKFAPGQNKHGFMVFVLCANHDGQVRGGIRHTWRLVKDKLTLGEAKALLEKRVGVKMWSE